MSEYLDKLRQHVDVSSDRGLDRFVKSLSCASFQARNLSRCVEVYERMLGDDDAVIFLGIAGALVPGGMRKVIVDLIRNHLVDVLVSTGANLYHDFFEALGYHHYIGDSNADDGELRKARVDRIYDTYVSDAELVLAEKRISEIASQMEPQVYSSREFLEHLAGELDDDESILLTAKKEGVPIFCPALCDSAIGMALMHYYVQRQGESRLIVDQIRDNFEIFQIKRDAVRTGAIYLGGGVPKNYIQQLTPMLDVLGIKGEGHKYFIQLTTDDPKYGGLSGCTASESKSWGKVTREGFSATAYVDATIGLPLVAGAVLCDCSGGPARAKRIFCWERDNLEDIRIE